MNKVCIVGGKRIPFARSGGSYINIGNRELMSAALKHLVDEFNLKGKTVGEVSLGAVLKHSYDFGLARECTINSGLSWQTPAYDIQKACGTSLEAAINIGYKIAVGQIDCGIAGGVDTNSDIPVEFKKSFSDRLVKMNYARSMGDKLKALIGLNPAELLPKIPAVKEPRTGLSMGESCEIMAKTWNISREDQDQLAFESHAKAAKAYEEGFHQKLIGKFNGLEKDNILRADTTVEKLAKLKPVFNRSETGTLTAGNSTPLTDGAAAVFLCSEEYAKKNNLEVLCYLSFAQSAAVNYVDDEGLLMAPAYAVPKLLEKSGYSLQDFDFYEIHEAFAAQVLCTLKAWEDEKFCREKLGLEKSLGSIDKNKLNVKGGSLAIGHPFAATGARILTSAGHILHNNGGGRLLVSICTAGGMGVVAALEK